MDEYEIQDDFIDRLSKSSWSSSTKFVAGPLFIIGAPNRVYEVLSRKRPLTLRMIWRLHKQLGIPAESLIRPLAEKVVG